MTAAFLLPCAAQAEIKAGSFELNPYVGYNFFDSQHNLKNKPVIGGRVGYNFTNHFGIEGAVDFSATGVDDKSATWSDEGEFTSPIDDVDITSYSLDLLYHFMPEGKFNPFIAAGYGASHYSPDISSDDIAVFNYGVGAKYWVAENIAIRADIRDNLIIDEQLHNLSATAGVVFAFGGKSAAPTAVAKPLDSDKDRVVDSRDKCPETPGGVVVDKDGCPKVKKVYIRASDPEEKVIAAAAEPDEIVVLAFEDVHFGFNQSALTPAAKKILKRNIRILKKKPKSTSPDCRVYLCGRDKRV